MRALQTLGALSLLLGAAGAVHAQALRPFCAERPGKATPPCILDAGHAQLEVGLADAALRRGGGVHEDVYALAAAELRFGLAPRWEAQAAWTPLVVDRLRGSGRRSGTGDATLALKWALTDPSGEGPAAAAQAFLVAPTATQGMGAGGFEGGVRLPLSTPLGADWSLGLTPEVDVVRGGGGGAHLAWTGVAALGRNYGAASFGAEIWAMDDRGAWQASLDLTAARAVGDNAQLDAGVNLGLNSTTPDVEVYVGVARRF
jgi:hypothetical protein